MAAPWEKYGASASGPWAKYGGDKTEPTPEARPEKTPLDQIKDAIFVSPDQQEKLKPGLEGVWQSITDIPAEMGKQSSEALTRLGKDLTRPASEIAKDPLSTVTPFGPAPRIALDALGYLGSPVTGAVTSILGRPVEHATGVKRQITGDLASALIPIPGADAGAAAKATEAAAEPASYAAKVERLRKEGIEPTAGQERGGQLRRREEAAKSDPFVGGAVRDQETKALESLNKALYNRALEPIGQKFTGTLVGRDSVKQVGDKISAAYDELKPKMKLVPDEEGLSSLASLRTRVGELPPAQSTQFENILNNRVIHRLGETGELDGETFKQVESEISLLARNYKSSPDPAQRGLGEALEDMNGILRDNMARTSDPSVRAELQKVNSAWAILTRVEDAAQARKGGGGLITPADLLGSIRKMDRSVRHRAFARGDAMLQKLGEDAFDVLGNKMPDSGTPERLAFNHHGLMTYLGGKVTNPIAYRAMEAAKRKTPLPPLQFPRYSGLPLALQAGQNQEQ